ncbi:fructose-bisphosphatase class III [Coprobacillaceae bacterium CR2/5/TPMF4]|nr:fructose-bisphosphatase class III [Coprobacillaceae bacterium CR2/5/TPMF4]
METRYLELLAEKYRNIDEVTAEIMNLGTILSLPKGTEFFFSDLHGEHLAFIHLLKSASGVIKIKLIYYLKNSYH